MFKLLFVACTVYMLPGSSCLGVVSYRLPYTAYGPPSDTHWMILVGTYNNKLI